VRLHRHRGVQKQTRECPAASADSERLPRFLNLDARENQERLRSRRRMAGKPWRGGDPSRAPVPPRLRVPARVSYRWCSAPLAAANVAGIARERAQGQVTTNTARVADIARCGSKTLQNTATTSASVSVTKENQEATRVATATVRGFSAPASCSNSMISASVDCAADFALRISDATDIRCRRWTSSKYEPCPRADVRTTGA
jgi:hypothetical protein